MMHLQHQVTLIFTLAALSQLSLAIASTQECIQQGDGLPTLSMSSFATSLIAQCPTFANNSTTIDCAIDLSDVFFPIICNRAGGEVYDYDYLITCPSSDSDGTRKITVNNFFVCAATNCTTDDMKAIFEGGKDFVSLFGEGCSVETVTVEVYNYVSPSAQECQRQSYPLPYLSRASIRASQHAQCPSLEADPESDCVVDFTDSSFPTTCKSAGGEVYDYDYTNTCPSSDADGTQKFTANNYFRCAAKICTTDDLKELFEYEFAALWHGCSETLSIGSGSTVIGVSTSLIWALAASLLFLVNIL